MPAKDLNCVERHLKRPRYLMMCKSRTSRIADKGGEQKREVLKVEKYF